MRNFDDDVAKLYLDFEQAKVINESNFKKIINDNQDTPFGKRFGFKDIHSIEDFRNAVPLTDYSYYEEGNQYVYDVGYHLATSGTLGKQKKFTVSKLAMELSAGYNFEMPFYLMHMPTSNGLHISIFRDPKKETLLSCALYDYVFNNGYTSLSDWCGPDFMFCDTTRHIPYIKSYIALAHKEIAYIDSIFIYDILLVMKYMQDNHELLLNDIKNHTISVDLSDEEKKLLLKEEFSKERIEEIETIFNEGFDSPFVKKLFPNLKFVSGVGGGKYKVYDEGLKKMIGNDVAFFYYIFAQTECTMAVPLKMNEASFAMMPRTCFMEYRDIHSDRVYLPHEVIIGNEYEPIVTTFSGLYRYHTGDTVRVKYFEKETPVVEILGRIASIINIAGEKVDDADISLVMDRLKEKYSFNQFAVGIDNRVFPNRYVLFIETDSIQENFASDFDKELSKTAYDYWDLRRLAAIGEPIAKAITTEQFASIQKGQIKPKVVLKDEQVKAWL